MEAHGEMACLLVELPMERVEPLIDGDNVLSSVVDRTFGGRMSALCVHVKAGGLVNAVAVLVAVVETFFARGRGVYDPMF